MPITAAASRPDRGRVCHVSDMLVQLYCICRASLPPTAFSVSCASGGGGVACTNVGGAATALPTHVNGELRPRAAPLGIIAGVDVHSFLLVRE